MATDLLTADNPTERIGRRPIVIDPSAGIKAEKVSAQKLNDSAAQPRTATAIIKDFVELTKPRIVTMILVTTTATAIIGAGGLVGIVDLFWLLVGTGAIAGSAGSANQVWERVIDRNMTRTANRPLPASRIGTGLATAFTLTLGIIGSVLLWQMFGVQPAIAGIATWALYVLVYTPMKTRTAWNTTVGAIAERFRC